MSIKSSQTAHIRFNANGNPDITKEILDQYEENGFLLIPSLLSPEEVTKLKATVEKCDGLQKHVIARKDGAGGVARSVIWRHPADDITGVISRSEKIAGTMEKLLGGEVYHYHSKIILKDAHTGGMFIWHQDYGYWYSNSCLYPNMGTVFIAIDRAHVGNGCLKVIKGSHKMGRLDHRRVADQVGADEERVKVILSRSELIEVEMEPGDVLFFHCNLLHTSDQNKSDDRRWALLTAYNRADNNPAIEHHFPQYTPLKKVSNSCILNSKSDNLMNRDNFFKLEEDDRFRRGNEK